MRSSHRQRASGIWALAALVSAASGSRAETAGVCEPERAHGSRQQDAAVAALAGVRPYESCSGTLIEPQVVLTAAHCLYGRSLTQARFELGSGVEELRIASVRIHPLFDASTLAHDVALAFLERAASARPVELGGTADVPLSDERIRFVGYGGQPTGRDPSRNSRHSGWMKVQTIDNDSLRAVPDPSNACAHDSGGAAFAHDRLVGVVSGGDLGCARFSVFARIDIDLAFVWDGVAPLSEGGR